MYELIAIAGILAAPPYLEVRDTTVEYKFYKIPLKNARGPQKHQPIAYFSINIGTNQPLPYVITKMKTELISVDMKFDCYAHARDRVWIAYEVDVVTLDKKFPVGMKTPGTTYFFLEVENIISSIEDRGFKYYSTITITR